MNLGYEQIRRISNFQCAFSLKSQIEEFNIFFERFLQGDLGKIYQGIPWNELVKVLGIKSSKYGQATIFSAKGKLALMFLKHYACYSDKLLIEQLNGSHATYPIVRCAERPKAYLTYKRIAAFFVTVDSFFSLIINHIQNRLSDGIQ